MRAKSVNIDAENPERKAGFLTETEREFLLNEWQPGDTEPGEYTDSQIAYKKADIRVRARHALADIALLQKHADSDIIGQILEEDSDLKRFRENTLEHVQHGLIEFMLYLIYEDEEAEELVNQIHLIGENIEQLFEDITPSVPSEELEHHTKQINPPLTKIEQYAEANDLEREDIIYMLEQHWDEN